MKLETEALIDVTHLQARGPTKYVIVTPMPVPPEGPELISFAMKDIEEFKGVTRVKIKLLIEPVE